MSENEGDFINILLLGETGTGKSAFINSFGIYLKHSSLEEAVNAFSEKSCMIPVKFSVTTEDGDSRTLHFKNDPNEDKTQGNSSTQATISYLFPYDSKVIRIIDTPGINDSRGAITKDKENFENILEYIGKLKYLHAVCFLLKPDVTVLTDAFKYCMCELLSRLDRSAADNIVFFFTRTRSTDYKAPETINCLRRVLEEIKSKVGVSVPLRFKNNEHKNCFYFDNEVLKYLVAQHQGENMGTLQSFQKSWEVSSKSTRSFTDYILGTEEHPVLPPHNIRDTVSVNSARTLISELSKPLADISQLVQDNVSALQKHMDTIQQENLTGEELRKLLYVPVIDLKQTELDHPVLVCAAAKCRETYTVAGVVKYHYKERCHDPCESVPKWKWLFGEGALKFCDNMSGGECIKCGCNWSTHMHVSYETKAVEERILNQTVKSQLNSNENILNEQKACVKALKERIETYKSEQEEIAKALATFAYFLSHNSILPINDAYERYLNCLIATEQNAERVALLESLKRAHIEQKRIVEEAGKNAKEHNITHITSADILKIGDRLKQLKHVGETFNNLHQFITNCSAKKLEDEMRYEHLRSKKPWKVVAMGKSMFRALAKVSNVVSGTASQLTGWSDQHQNINQEQDDWEAVDALELSGSRTPRQHFGNN